jgi:hypothetical protein
MTVSSELPAQAGGFRKNLDPLDAPNAVPSRRTGFADRQNRETVESHIGSRRAAAYRS